MLFKIYKVVYRWKQQLVTHFPNMSKKAAKGQNGVEGKTVLKNYSLRRRKLKVDEIATAIHSTEDEPKKSNKMAIDAKKSPRKTKSVKTVEEDKSGPSTVETKNGVVDIEDAVWQPKHWEIVLENIMEMRKMHVAPVDSMGCEQCPDPAVTPKIRRYQTLISLMLSSQTKDQVTYAAMQRLRAHGLTVDNILLTSDDKLGELIYPVGFWHSKVKYIKNTSQILKDQYKGDIPSTIVDLCKLPGVGPKMANLAMTCGWNKTVGIAVDTHVHRISNRLGWVPKATKAPEQTRIALEKWLPKHLWRDINLAMVGFGQTICRPIQPNCSDCLNQQLCPFSKKNLTSKKSSTGRQKKPSV